MPVTVNKILAVTARESLVAQNEPPTELRKDGRRKGPQHEKGIASKIAAETGLSKATVNRVLNPPKKPDSPPSAPDNPMKAYNRWAGEMRHQRYLEAGDQIYFLTQVNDGKALRADDSTDGRIGKTLAKGDM